MADCNCPYCGADIDMSSEEPMGDDDAQEVNCAVCSCTLIVRSTVYMLYEAHCVDGRHDFVPNEHHPGWVTCTKCNLFTQGTQPAALGETPSRGQALPRRPCDGGN